MKGIFYSAIVLLAVLSLALFVRIETHSNHMAIVTKELDTIKPIVVNVPKSNPPDCYSKEYYQYIATDASKKTVDFIVNRMLTDKFIIVNKDGMSYRFKLIKRFKQGIKK